MEQGWPTTPEPAATPDRSTSDDPAPHGMILGAPTTICFSRGSPSKHVVVRSRDCVVENMNVGEGAKLVNNVQKRHGGIPVTSEDCVGHVAMNVGDNQKYDIEECRTSSTPSSMSNIKLREESCACWKKKSCKERQSSTSRL